MNRRYPRIELAANVLIIVVAVLMSGAIIQRTFFPEALSASGPDLPKVGDKVPLADFDWSKSERNVLLVLQKGCQYCSRSADFYKKLIEETRGRDVNLVAVFPQAREEAEKYLGELGLPPLEVRQSQLEELLVAGTPTIIVTDRRGVITNVWLGKLPPAKEQEVLAALKS